MRSPRLQLHVQARAIRTAIYVGYYVTLNWKLFFREMITMRTFSLGVLGLKIMRQNHVM